MDWLISTTHPEPANEELGIKPSLRMQISVIFATGLFWVFVVIGFLALA